MKNFAAFRSLGRQGSMFALLGACILAACASGTQGSGSGYGNGGNSGTGGSSGGATAGTTSGGFGGSTGTGTVSVAGCNPCMDFTTPVMDGSPPANAASMFGAAGSGSSTGGPCLVEPQIGALFPNNWLRPRFVLAPASSSQNLFEIRLHNSIETNDLVVYTTNTTWTMPKDMWSDLAGHVEDSPITVTVRGMSSSGGTPAVGSTGTITIAPAGAGGSMVYWSAAGMDMNAMNTKLEGFKVGDESTVAALQTAQVQMKVRATWGAQSGDLKDQTTQVQCIGCHTATPDQDYVAFAAQWPWPIAIAGVTSMNVGTWPTWLGGAPANSTSMPAGAYSNLSPNTMGAYQYNSSPDVSPFMLGISTFSKAHFATGDRIMIASEGSAWYTPPATNNMSSCGTPTGCPTGTIAQLAWFDLEATTAGSGFGQIARSGDTSVNGAACPGGSCSAGAPNWSHDGNNIVYVSTDTGVEDGRMGHGNTDLKIVPYADKAGGAVESVAAASDPAYNEYYPAFSPDDTLIAFNRVAAGHNMFIEPTAEVFVAPASGSATKATRLAANDPVSCSGMMSPGVYNTWPKWCPTSTTVNGKTYYWLIFSSRRSGGGSMNAQLFVTGVVVDGQGNIETYPAIYLWNQDATVNNEIPAWDNIQIPPVMVQ